MSKPIAALVGRPNVGKSTFFNRICGKRISIVKDTPGVTRDRIYADAEWCSHKFTLIDTGGIVTDKDYIGDTAALIRSVREQAQTAVELADAVIFIVDGKQGLIDADEVIAQMLRKSNKPVILVVNKIDNYDVSSTYDFYKLGFGTPFAVSSEHGLGLGDVLDALVSNFDTEKAHDDEQNGLKLALVGKPNVGKSSLINSLLGFNRVIVSDTAGTTRDAVDTPFEYGGESYILIDTAGIRRKRAIEPESVERYSILRALTAVKRADVVLIVMDATEEISEQDIKIAGLVNDEGKPSVIVMNKWDAVEKDTYTADKIKAKLKEDLNFMGYHKPVFVSARTGKRVNELLSMAKTAHQNASRRIATGALNEVIMEAVAITEPPSHAGKRLKVYYSTQAEVCPPTFVLFVNDKDLVHFSYKRYLENRLRAAADFSCTPVVLKFVNKEQTE